MRRKVRKQRLKKARKERNAGQNKYSSMKGKLGQKELSKYHERYLLVKKYFPQCCLPSVDNIQGTIPNRDDYKELSRLYRRVVEPFF